MFVKYSNEKVFEVSKNEEVNTRLEFTRQRQFLEQSIVNLKKHITVIVKKSDSYNKIMEENMVLVKEIEKLRQKLVIYHKYNLEHKK